VLSGRQLVQAASQEDAALVDLMGGFNLRGLAVSGGAANTNHPSPLQLLCNLLVCPSPLAKSSLCAGTVTVVTTTPCSLRAPRHWDKQARDPRALSSCGRVVGTPSQA
jgi:hypothetical protein